ncbi:flagellar motor switch protein FliG [Roseobacter denitrificans]|nr:FliG C-terminal domain-containing protein [Roseobacter denitrificans]AVL51626.1 flagellar motor switch protein FliG [Roseobacter denitrificans]SFF77523.1 flagellar motor switch protein FliG [Roseobacter denitrificans OCh 114]
MTEMVPIGSFPALPGSPASAPVPLSRKAKAAIVVRLLINEGADIPLEDLPEELQARLTQQMGSMRTVDRTTLASVVDEFAQELESIGLSFTGGIAGALDALEGKISKQTADRLRKEAGVRRYGNPWERLRELGTEKLLPVLQNESTEVAAVLLSKLDVKRAAELLGKLPGPEARRITYAVSLTSAVTPDAVDRIGLSLAAQLDAEPVRAFDNGPVERVGAILNSTTTVTRDDVLEGLDETDAGFAEMVRRAIFTFANIPQRIAARDIPRVVRALDQEALVTALAGAEAAGMQASAEFILENMSGRMADQLREEVQERETVKSADMEEASALIVQAIRELEASGDLLLIVEEGEPE